MGVDAGAESGTAAGFHRGALRLTRAWAGRVQVGEMGPRRGPLMHNPPSTSTADAGRHFPGQFGGQGSVALSARYLASSDQRNLDCRPPNINPVKRSLVEDTDAAAPPLIGSYRHARPSLEFLLLSTISLFPTIHVKRHTDEYTCVGVRGEIFTGCCAMLPCHLNTLCVTQFERDQNKHAQARRTPVFAKAVAN